MFTHMLIRIVECTDWMMYRMTGEWTLSMNHVAVKWNYARPEGGWPFKLLKAVGLSDLVEKWPDRLSARTWRCYIEQAGSRAAGASCRNSSCTRGN